MASGDVQSVTPQTVRVRPAGPGDNGL